MDDMPEDKQLPKHEHVYAIVRYNDYQGLQVSLEDKITIKMLVWTKELAEAEVKRLNGLNGPKGSLYFWKRARLASKTDEH